MSCLVSVLLSSNMHMAYTRQWHTCIDMYPMMSFGVVSLREMLNEDLWYSREELSDIQFLKATKLSDIRAHVDINLLAYYIFAASVSTALKSQ